MTGCAIALALLLLALRLFGNHIRLRSIPGSWFAGLTDCWRWSLRGSSGYGRRLLVLHETYGRVVRLGPNCVSVSDTTLRSFQHEPRLISQNDGTIAMRQPLVPCGIRSPPYPDREEYLGDASIYEGSIDHLVSNFVRTFQAHSIVDLSDLVHFLGRDFISILTMDDHVDMHTADRRVLVEGYQQGHARTLFSQCTMQHLAINHPKVRMRRLCPLRRPRMSECRSTEDEYRMLSGNILPQTDAIQCRSHFILQTILDAFVSTFCFLSYCPDVMSSLKSEIKKASADGDLSEVPRWAELSSLRYLDAVMKEAMRFSPRTEYYCEDSIPTGGMDILGHFIPEKTTIVCHSQVARNSCDVYGNRPDTFDPERWMTVGNERLATMEENLVPYRTSLFACPKSRAAWLELKKATVWVLRDLN